MADACASLGFSIRGAIAMSPAVDIPRQVVRCEIDVVATFILYLHASSQKRRSRMPILNSLPSFGHFLRDRALRAPHLERFAESEMFGPVSCSAWGAS